MDASCGDERGGAAAAWAGRRDERSERSERRRKRERSCKALRGVLRACWARLTVLASDMGPTKPPKLSRGATGLAWPLTTDSYLHLLTRSPGGTSGVSSCHGPAAAAPAAGSGGASARTSRALPGPGTPCMMRPCGTPGFRVCCRQQCVLDRHAPLPGCARRRRPLPLGSAPPPPRRSPKTGAAAQIWHSQTTPNKPFAKAHCAPRVWDARPPPNAFLAPRPADGNFNFDAEAPLNPTGTLSGARGETARAQPPNTPAQHQPRWPCDLGPASRRWLVPGVLGASRPAHGPLLRAAGAPWRARPGWARRPASWASAWLRWARPAPRVSVPRLWLH